MFCRVPDFERYKYAKKTKLQLRGVNPFSLAKLRPPEKPQALVTVLPGAVFVVYRG